jgi:acid phosphatase
MKKYIGGVMAVATVISMGACVSPVKAASTAAGSKVLVVIEENHTQAAVQSGMPYLVSLGTRYGHTTNYVAAVHPSLPNYLAITGGSTRGVTDDGPPSQHPLVGKSVFATGGGSYEQSMPSNCRLTDSGAYAVKHNPQAYYVNERSNCAAHDKPLTALAVDLASGLPNVTVVTPDLNNDAHNGTLAQADGFLKAWIPKIMAGKDYKAGRLTVVVTFDEGVGTSQTIYAAVIHPSLHGKVVTQHVSHYSLSRWLYRTAGIPPQSGASGAVDMGAMFGR